jgi:hypothetical protein
MRDFNHGSNMTTSEMTLSMWQFHIFEDREHAFFDSEPSNPQKQDRGQKLTGISISQRDASPHTGAKIAVDHYRWRRRTNTRRVRSYEQAIFESDRIRHHKRYHCPGSSGI